MDFSFLNDEKLKHMDPRKVQILKELASSTEGKDLKDMAPFLVQANKKMQEQKISFTKEETEIMLTIMTRGMTPKDLAKVEMMKKMVNGYNNRKK